MSDDLCHVELVRGLLSLTATRFAPNPQLVMLMPNYLKKLAPKKFHLLLPALLVTQFAQAISNIENERPNLPEQGWSGSVKVGLNGKTGNQEERSHEGVAKVIYRVNDEIFMVIADRDYGSTRGVKTTDKEFLHGRWVHVLNYQWAVESFAQWQTDEFDNLTSRVLAGGGGRYIVAQERDVYSFALGLGAFYETEKQNLVSYQETNKLWRMNAYYTYKYQINDNVAFANTTYYQPGLSDFDDFRVLFDAGISVKLSTNLQLQVNYQLTHDSEPAQNLSALPPIDNHKTNTEYKTALLYSF